MLLERIADELGKITTEDSNMSNLSKSLPVVLVYPVGRTVTDEEEEGASDVV